MECTMDASGSYPVGVRDEDDVAPLGLSFTRVVSLSGQVFLPLLKFVGDCTPVAYGVRSIINYHYVSSHLSV
jgi:hypothetical protein